MKRIVLAAAVVITMMLQGGTAFGQSVPAVVQKTPGGQPASAPTPAASGGTAVTAETTHLTDKQRLLAEEADRLVVMANDLKVQVDKTNKNILSMTVVKKAAEIEAYARLLKSQGKK